MTEIFSIFLHTISLLILSCFPFKIFTFIKDKNLYMPASIVTLSFILLVLSFFNVELQYVEFILWIIIIINLFYLIKDKNYLLFVNIRYLFFYAVFLSLSFDLAVNLKLGWDAQNYWIIKSLNFINGGTVQDLQNLPRPDYPYFGSYIWAVFSKLSILEYEYFGRIFYIYLFTLSAFVISNYFNVKEFYKIIIFLLLILILNNNYISSGFQEILVFSYAIFLTCFFINFQKTFKNKTKILFLLMMFFLIFWIKNEALIFSLLFFISIIIFYPKKDILIFSSLFFLLIILRIFLFKLFGLNLDLQSGNYESFLIRDIIQFISVERILIILKYFIIASFKIPIVVFIFLAVYLNFFLEKSLINKILFVNFNLNIFFIFSAYLFTSFPLVFHLSTSLDRLFFQVSGFNILALFILVNRFKLK